MQHLQGSGHSPNCHPTTSPVPLSRWGGQIGACVYPRISCSWFGQNMFIIRSEAINLSLAATAPGYAQGRSCSPWGVNQAIALFVTSLVFLKWLSPGDSLGEDMLREGWPKHVFYLVGPFSFPLLRKFWSQHIWLFVCVPSLSPQQLLLNTHKEGPLTWSSPAKSCRSFIPLPGSALLSGPVPASLIIR